MPAATLLLPSRGRFGGRALPPPLAQALGRADVRVASGPTGAFDILPRGWPVAAATRQRDAGDAPGAAWMRADPAYVRPDINGARLLAIGDGLGLDAEQAEALLRPLRPLFGDAGMPIDAPAPGRWYLRLAADAPLPALASPEQALGADLFDHLPAGGEGRRWRALLSEAQVVLHNHPLNADRAGRGLAPVNSLWFWGAGRLPDHVTSPFARVLGYDDALDAFATLAGREAAPLPPAWQQTDADVLVDLRGARDFEQLCGAWLLPLVGDIAAGRLDGASLDWADGARHVLRRGQRWRFWRGGLRELAPAAA